MFPFPPASRPRLITCGGILSDVPRAMVLLQRCTAPYPLQEFDLANRVAVLAMQEGWCEDYVQATYRRWFVDGLEAGSEPNLSQSLAEVGQDTARVVERADDLDIEAAYVEQTDRAQRAGIFGSPSFIVDGEVFWGDDRLEDAITWAKNPD